MTCEFCERQAWQKIGVNNLRLCPACFEILEKIPIANLIDRIDENEIEPERLNIITESIKQMASELVLTMPVSDRIRVSKSILTIKVDETEWRLTSFLRQKEPYERQQPC